MSNYVYGCFDATRYTHKEQDLIVRSIQHRSVIGFHVVSGYELVTVLGDAIPVRQIYFCLSDDFTTLLATDLIIPLDCVDDEDDLLPAKLTDRIQLIVDQVGVILEETKGTVLHLWISEVDQWEETTSVNLSELSVVLCADFLSKGIPCNLYHIHV